MFNFKKSLIFLIALIVAGLVPFIFSTNSIEAKMEKEPEMLAPQGGNAWDLSAGNYDDRDQNDSTESETTKKKPTPTTPTTTTTTPSIVDPTEDPNWPEHFNRTGD